VPTAKNKRAFEEACKLRCKKERDLRPNPKEVNIKPSWERVERATIFLRSASKKAEKPAKRVVTRPRLTKVGAE
jgi:hypothetical protein